MLRRIHELALWKRKPFLVLTALFLGLFFLLVVRMMLPCREYRLEGTHVFEQEEAGVAVAVYDGICLEPGVWQAVLEYETDSDLVALCKVEDSTVFHGGLLTNGEHLYSGLGETGFCFWLYEGTNQLQVTVSYGGTGSLVTGGLTIRETRQLWSMLLAILFFLGVAAYVILIYRYYDEAYPVAQEKKHVFFCVGVITLLASVPYLCGYTITGADFTYHLQRIEGVKDGLMSGQFPVRLEPRWLYDHGYADGIFYCNTLLYFPALLRMLGFPICASYNMYCIVLNAATAWIAYFVFYKMFGKRNIGIVCSALYTLSVFRIYKLVITSAVGEGSAFTFLPLVLYGLYRIFTENVEDKQYRTAWISLAVGFTGLIQTHVLTCEITALVTIFFCLANLPRVFRKKTFLELVKGAIFAVLVSLWFLVPFLDYYLTQDVHIRHVAARTIQDRGLYLAHLLFHFWTTGTYTPMGDNGMQYSHPVGIGLVLMVGLGVFLILWFSGAFGKKQDKRIMFLKQTALAGVLLLLMSLKVFPWDRIQSLHPAAAALVSSLQFPNRFLGWGTVCLTAVFGFCLEYLERQGGRRHLLLLATAVAAIATSGMYLTDYVNYEQDYYELYNEEGMGFGYIAGAEYLIQGTEEAQLTFAGPQAGPGVEVRDYEKRALGALVVCANQSEREGYVEVPLLLYKGYRAKDQETGQLLAVTAGTNQTVRIAVPAHYQGSLEVCFISPFYWRISELISVCTVAGLVAAGWRYRRKRGC